MPKWLALLIASAFNLLGQYASSPGNSAYFYAEYCSFFPNGGHNLYQYWFCLQQDGQAEFIWMAG